MHASSDGHEAAELFRTRQYRAAAALLLELLARRPDDLELRILRARSLMALRADEEAKHELSRAIRLDRRSGEAHRLLGELAIRCGKMDAAATLLRQAVRYSPGDTMAASLLELLNCSSEGLSTSDARAQPRASRSPALRAGPHVARSVSIQPTAAAEKLPAAAAAVGWSAPARPRLAIGSHSDDDQHTMPVRARFGRYLVEIGALTPLQLRAALDYHKRAGVRVGAAAVALGFMSEPRVEWAAHDFHQRQ